MGRQACWQAVYSAESSKGCFKANGKQSRVRGDAGEGEQSRERGNTIKPPVPTAHRRQQSHPASTRSGFFKNASTRRSHDNERDRGTPKSSAHCASLPQHPTRLSRPSGCLRELRTIH